VSRIICAIGLPRSPYAKSKRPDFDFRPTPTPTPRTPSRDTAEIRETTCYSMMHNQDEDIAASVLAGFNAASTDAPAGEGSGGAGDSGSEGKRGKGEAPPIDSYPNKRKVVAETGRASDGNNNLPDNSNPKRRRSRKKRFNYPVEPQAIQIVTKSRDYVDHSYRDFSRVPPEESHDGSPKRIEDMTFSEKVHHILSQGDKYGKWIAWLPHGRAFRVDFPVLFERHVCERYFGHKRYSSFLRQLNNHGFKHITKGTDRNSYYHEVRLESDCNSILCCLHDVGWIIVLTLDCSLPMLSDGPHSFPSLVYAPWDASLVQIHA